MQCCTDEGCSQETVDELCKSYFTWAAGTGRYDPKNER